MSGIIAALAGGVSPGLRADTVTHSVASGTAVATWDIGSDGFIDAGPVATHPYYSTGYSGAGYEFRATPTSGTFTSGTTGTWLPITALRQYEVTRGIVGSKTCTATMEIRDAGTLAVVTTASVTLTATRT